MEKQQTPKKPQAQIWAEEGRSFVINDLDTYRIEPSGTSPDRFILVDLPGDTYFASIKRIDNKGFSVIKYMLNQSVVVRVKWSECRFENPAGSGARITE